MPPRSGAASCSALAGLLGQSERQGQEAHRSEGGVDHHTDPGAAPPLYNVGQDQRDRHKGHQDLPREGGVEQQPQESIHQPSPPPEGRLLPRQRDPPPGELFPNDVEPKKRQPRAEDPVPAGIERLEGHERRMEIRLALQPPRAAPRPPVSPPTAANPPTAQSQSPPFIGRSHSRAPQEPCHPRRRSRYNSRPVMRSRGPKTTALAAKNHITTGSAPVAEASVGTASRVVRNSSRAPAPNSAAEPTRR